MSAPIRKVAVLSVHTSPLDQPGTGDGGGLNVYVLEVARRLARRGVEVEIFTRATSRDATPIVQVVDGPTVHHIPAGPRRPVDKDELPNHLCAFLLGLEAHIDQHDIGRDFDVIHAHYWMSGWVGRRLRQRWDLPLVQTFHTMAAVKNAALSPGDRAEPMLRVIAEERLIAEADRIVVPVCGEARLLHSDFGTSGARLAVVSPGVDLEVFTPGPAAVPAEAPDGDGPLLLFVGRLQPLKGPDVAVRTLAAVHEQVADARLLVVGGRSGRVPGAGPDDLLRLAGELGVGDAVAVTPARPQRELAALYRAADVVLVPSRSESFGLVALEAQACGTPVVAADVGGLRAVVAGGGTLVPGHDPSDHAAAVFEYLVDPARRERASRLGRRTAAAASWERTVDGLLEVYAEVAAGPVRHRAGA